MERVTYILFSVWLAIMAPAVAGRVTPIRWDITTTKTKKRRR